jgi:omega-amidase
MEVVAIQFDIAWENKIRNFERVRELVRSAQPGAGALIVLPEMFATGFTMNSSAMAEDYGSETEHFLGALAREHSSFVIAGAAMRGRDGKTRNKALAFSPDGRLAGFYAKIQLFGPLGEDQAHAAGERVAGIRLGNWTISPFVCYDLRFPELFRAASKAHQPELFVVIANWAAARIEHWSALLRARAIENQAWVVGLNRVGSDPSGRFNGRSAIIDPKGVVIAEADDQERVLRATLDLQLVQNYRREWPFLADFLRKADAET